MKLHLQTLKCLKCGHSWIPRQPEVRICPSCKTAYWDVKRSNKLHGQTASKKIL